LKVFATPHVLGRQDERGEGSDEDPATDDSNEKRSVDGIACPSTEPRRSRLAASQFASKPSHTAKFGRA
jgi:hypothetical protein